MSLSLDRLSSTSNVWTKFRPTWLRRGQSKKHRSPSTSPTPSASSTSSDTSNESDTTSAAPSIAVEIEAKEPPSVVEPQVPAMIVVPQKRASPKSKKQQIIDTSLNTLKISLDLLAKAPFPGADLAAHALIESIKRVQEIKAVAEGLKQLAQRMAMVQPLVATANPSNPSTCAPLLRELEQLALDIDDAAKEGRVAKFFNVNDNASKISKCTQTIDSMMLDLSLSVGLDTHELVKSALDKVRARFRVNLHLSPTHYQEPLLYTAERRKQEARPSCYPHACRYKHGKWPRGRRSFTVGKRWHDVLQR
ncbi:hypothetical protein BDV98DRAFT_81096 [Pterulicium gracile]|uniref:Uncharacterized protein n=1 Tax=Pterulicium gracile TaxID=1884261 RepID=A0A5C3QMI3_9AGAR|nr:hypothetical protein BDV98DRAFT_81096 [Pterula gracilis]